MRELRVSKRASCRVKRVSPNESLYKSYHQPMIVQERKNKKKLVRVFVNSLNLRLVSFFKLVLTVLKKSRHKTTIFAKGNPQIRNIYFMTGKF